MSSSASSQLDRARSGPSPSGRRASADAARARGGRCARHSATPWCTARRRVRVLGVALHRSPGRPRPSPASRRCRGSRAGRPRGRSKKAPVNYCTEPTFRARGARCAPAGDAITALSFAAPRPRRLRRTSPRLHNPSRRHAGAHPEGAPVIKRRQLIQSAAGLGLASLGVPVLAQQGKIVLGQSAALSGPAAALGQQFRLGAQLVFERVNARGGVNGRTIRLADPRRRLRVRPGGGEYAQADRETTGSSRWSAMSARRPARPRCR